MILSGGAGVSCPKTELPGHRAPTELAEHAGFEDSRPCNALHFRRMRSRNCNRESPPAEASGRGRVVATGYLLILDAAARGGSCPCEHDAHGQTPHRTSIRSPCVPAHNVKAQMRAKTGGWGSHSKPRPHCCLRATGKTSCRASCFRRSLFDASPTVLFQGCQLDFVVEPAQILKPVQFVRHCGHRGTGTKCVRGGSSRRLRSEDLIKQRRTYLMSL